MATLTLGTVSTTSLTALQYLPGSMADADVATIAAGILDDQVMANAAVQRVIAGAFSRAGQLLIPGRGMLKLNPLDWVAVDTVGGTVLLIPGTQLPATLSATCNGGTNGTPGTITFAAACPASWGLGMPIRGTNVATGAFILAISTDRKTVTANTTGTPTGAINVGMFIHS